MFETAMTSVLSNPKRLIWVGYALFRTSTFILMIAILAKAATKATEGIFNLSASTAHAVPLAEVLPSLPTWWVPESLSGTLLTISLGAMGLWLHYCGKNLQRYFDI